MSRQRVAILIAAHDPTATTRNFRRELDADLVEFHLPSGDCPTDVDYDAAVVTGSRASVYWDEDWIPTAREWVRDAHDAGVPLLGVCFGHQLVAEALGGVVEDMGEYEIGYRTVRHRGDDALFDGIDEEFLVFTTHSDTVTDLPPGAEVLAENDYGIHAFRKDDAFGVQFHPEYDVPTAANVTKGKDELDDDRLQRVLDGITDENFARACEAKQVFDNFLAHARDARTLSASD